MSNGIDEAAKTFDAILKTDPNRSTAKRAESGEGPEITMFPNLGELDNPDETAGGDDAAEPNLRGKEKEGRSTDPRNPREGDGEPGEDGDDDSAADDDGDEPDDEDEEEEEEDADEPDDEFLSQEVSVTVDGEPTKVTIKEALEGYTRTETFHRRMNQLDEAKKIVRKAAGDAVQNYEYSMNLAKQMQAHMEQMIPKEPDWDAEFAADPNRARTLQKYHEQAKVFREKLVKDTEEAQKKVMESNQAQLSAFAEEESLKFDSMNSKQWSDPKKKAKDLNSMRRTALTLGFTEQEISQVYDSRMLAVLLKASKFDRMMAAKPKPVNRERGKPVPVHGGGGAKPRGGDRGFSIAQKRLAGSGSIEDAAVVFDHLIGNKK